MYQFDWQILNGEWGMRLLQGAMTTIGLAALVIVSSFVIGLVLGILRWLKKWYIEPLCWLYAEFARNTPPIVQILFWYFSAAYILPTPLFDYMRSTGFEFTAAVLALSIYHGAFMMETVRAGLNSVSIGQLEAAQALGLNLVQRLRYVMLPQAMRVIVAPILNEMVGATKNTSLAMAIGVVELSYQTKYMESATFRGVEALAAATALYVILCSALSALGPWASKRLSRQTAQERITPVLGSA